MADTSQLMERTAHHSGGNSVIVRAVTLSVMIAFVLAAGAGWALEIPGRMPTKVNDFAGVLDAETEKVLEETLDRLEEETPRRIEIIVQTFRSLEGISMNDFLDESARTWRTGPDDEDNRVIFVAFIDDGKMRIGVGEGIVDILSHERARQVTRTQVLPHFVREDYDAGVRAGVSDMVRILRGEDRGSGSALGGLLRRILFFGLLLVLILGGFLKLRRARKR